MKERDLEFEVAFFRDVYERGKSDIRVIETLGHLFTTTGRITEGLRMDRRLVKLQPDNPLAHYNLGCSLALKSRKKDAVASIRRAIELGYRDFSWMNEDPDLENIRNYNGYLNLLNELEILD